WRRGARDASRALPPGVLPLSLSRRAADEGMAGDDRPGARVWSGPDGRPSLRAATLSAGGSVLSDRPSLVGTGGDPRHAAGGLPLYLHARIRLRDAASLDSLAPGVGPVRRRRRQGAHGSLERVSGLGAAGRWRSPVLPPSRA